MEEKNIVAIDLGTSKIALTVASVSGEDVQIVYYKEMPSHGIKYSSVYNILHVTEPLGRIIKDAEEALDIKLFPESGRKNTLSPSMRLYRSAAQYSAVSLSGRIIS